MTSGDFASLGAAALCGSICIIDICSGKKLVAVVNGICALINLVTFFYSRRHRRILREISERYDRDRRRRAEDLQSDDPTENS